MDLQLEKFPGSSDQPQNSLHIRLNPHTLHIIVELLQFNIGLLVIGPSQITAMNPGLAGDMAHIC